MCATQTSRSSPRPSAPLRHPPRQKNRCTALVDITFCTNPAMSLSYDEITDVIINYSIVIHRQLGPGLLESVYEMVLYRMLQRHGFKVERQLGISFEFDGMHFENGFRVDLLVENKVIVDLKSKEAISPAHFVQVNTYLKLSRKRLGLLINFGEHRLKDGIHRIVNNLPPGDSPLLRVNRPKAV